MKRYKPIVKAIFNSKLWTGSFTYWWIISFITVFLFDLFWMLQTTFSSMSYFAFWMVLILSSFFLSIPSIFTKNGVLQSFWLLFFDAIFIANLMYCYTYYDAIPLKSYGLVSNLSDFSASVIDAFKWYFISFPLLTILAFLYYFFNKTISKKLPNLPLFCVYVLIFSLALWISDLGRGGILGRMREMKGFASMATSIPAIYSLAGFLVTDYYTNSEPLSHEDEELAYRWLIDQNEFTKLYWEQRRDNDGVKPHNLIIILCESLESWPIGKIVEGVELTPNINSWTKDSSTFFAPNVVTQVGSGRSIDGQLLVMAGMLPMQNQVYSYVANQDKFYSLSQAMKENGGTSILFTADKPYVWNQALVNKAFETDTMIHGGNLKMDEKVGGRRKVSDGSLMRQIKEKLQNDNLWKPEQKSLIITVTYSGHNPFRIAENLRFINLEEDYPEIVKNYMIAANYTDNALGQFIDYLKSREDWEQTMVVITGDHEGLASDRKEALRHKNTRNIVDSLQHTPLLILNSPKPGRFDKQLGQVDIYSTILDLMGWEEFEWKGMGISVFDPRHPGVAVGSSGELIGDTTASDQQLIKHLQEAGKVSDLILKFNLLRNYPHPKSK